MRTIYCGNDVKLVIESALGDNFLSMEEWAQSNLTPAELEIYAADELTEEKKQFFTRWSDSQQITKLDVYVNDVLQ